MERSKWFDGGMIGSDFFNDFRVNYIVIPNCSYEWPYIYIINPGRDFKFPSIVTREPGAGGACTARMVTGVV